MTKRRSTLTSTSKANVELARVDAMSGLEFEAFIAELLTRAGYMAQDTQASGDFGVDVIAQKAGVRYAVQCKRYQNPVSRTAISDAVAGKYHWNCDEAWVITNSTFTKDAKTLAHSTSCHLTDREALLELIKKYPKGSRKRLSSRLAPPSDQSHSVSPKRTISLRRVGQYIAIIGLVGLILLGVALLNSQAPNSSESSPETVTLSPKPTQNFQETQETVILIPR